MEQTNLHINANSIKDAIAILPEKPGVYQYFDKNGTLIYVGKAKNLKKGYRRILQKNTNTPKRAF